MSEGRGTTTDLDVGRAWSLVTALADRIQRLEMHLESLVDAAYPFTDHQQYVKMEDVVIPGRDLGHGVGIRPAKGSDLDWLWRAQHAASVELYPDAAIEPHGQLADMVTSPEQPLPTTTEDDR